MNSPGVVEHLAVGEVTPGDDVDASPRLQRLLRRPPDAAASTPTTRVDGDNHFATVAQPLIVPPPPICTTTVSTRRVLEEQLERRGALAGRDERVVERRHVDAGRAPARTRAPPRPGGASSGRRSRPRRRNPPSPRASRRGASSGMRIAARTPSSRAEIATACAWFPGADRAHAARPLVVRQRRHERVRAAELECPAALEGLALEQHVRAHARVERARRHHRRPVRDAVEHLRGGPNIVKKSFGIRGDRMRRSTRAMPTPRVLLPLLALALAALLPASAAAEEKLLTLYSPAIETAPYVHETHQLPLRPNGVEAPAEPGYVTGIKEQVLVDSKDPDAKPLNNAKFMIHHFLYWAPGRVDQAPGSCWGASGFVAGRGEEHPDGDFSAFTPPEVRARYGITNRTAAGHRAGVAPDGDGDEPRQEAEDRLGAHEDLVHDRAARAGLARRRRQLPPPRQRDGLRRPGRRRAGQPSTSTSRAGRSRPASTGASSARLNHQHGGGKYHTLRSVSCDRELFRSQVYHAPPEPHLQHDPPDPPRARADRRRDVPLASRGSRSPRARSSSAARCTTTRTSTSRRWASGSSTWCATRACERCGAIPGDLREVNRPKRFDSTPNYALRVPQLAPPPMSALRPLGRSPLLVEDAGFARGRITAQRRPAGDVALRRRHAAHGDRRQRPDGLLLALHRRTRGDYTITPRRRGTYRLTCLVHPTRMGQTLVVR